MKRYKARNTSIYEDDDAQIIGSFLDERFPTGNFSPKDIVELARPVKSPIHKYFEWDDTKAAEKFRHNQAVRIIKCLVVEIQGVSTPQYVNLKLESEDKKPKYFKTQDCLQSPEMWQLVLEKALSELQSWRKRYDNFKELKPVYKTVDRILLKKKEVKNAQEENRTR